MKNKPKWYNEEMELYWQNILPESRKAMCVLMKGKRVSFNTYIHYCNRIICIELFMNGHDANSASDATRIPNGTVTDFFNEWLAEYL